MSVKSETTPPPCLICKQVVGNWAGMKAHLAAAHVLYRPHECAQCDYNSPDEDAMCKHSKETKHYVKLNEHYDFYKHRCLGRLLNDHLKRASPEGGRADAVVAMDASSSLPAVNPEPAAVAVVEETVGEKEEERGGGGDGVKTEYQAKQVGQKKAVGGTNTTQRIPPTVGGSRVVKPAAKTVTCRYQGCGVEVNVNHIAKHIETAHMQSIHCPVQHCPTVTGKAGKKQDYCRLETLSKHIKNCKQHAFVQVHGGPDSLSAEDKSRLDALAKKARQEVEKLRQQCYPGKVYRKRGATKRGGTNKAGSAKLGKK